MVNIVYTFVGTLFIQMWSIFIHLRVIYTIVVDFYTFEGSFIHLREFIHLRVQHTVGFDPVHLHLCMLLLRYLIHYSTDCAILTDDIILIRG